MRKEFDFPNLAETIYSSTSMDEVWNRYIEDLRKEHSIICNLYAKKDMHCF